MRMLTRDTFWQGLFALSGVTLLWLSAGQSQEADTSPPHPLDPISAQFDKDNDDILSAAELAAVPEVLVQWDTNGDHRVDATELAEAARSALRLSGPGGWGPPDGGGRGGPGGRGRGPRMQKRVVVPEFDSDGDGRLDREERDRARESLSKSADTRRRGPRGRRGSSPAGKPGPEVSPQDVAKYPQHSLYDTNIVRTIFLEFEHDDWNTEMAAFKDTDVEVPATMTVDGVQYPQVGVRFRGMSSFIMVDAQSKRSLNISVDFVNEDQRLYGHRTLNLLNGHGDASLMSSVLFAHLAGQVMPTTKANYVQVVINGRSWGVYVSVQQFNKDFLKQNYDSSKGTRWKVRGNPGADGGLRYLGQDLAPYRERFQIKSKDKDSAWQQLVNLCRVLEETPTPQLEGELRKIMDVDELLWFLAMDVASSNSDGYWTRASDYNLFLDKDGIFHVLAHDTNEAFKDGHGGPGGGPGGGRGRGPGGGRPGFGPPGFGPPGFGPPGFGPPRGGFGFGAPPERPSPDDEMSPEEILATILGAGPDRGDRRMNGPDRGREAGGRRGRGGRGPAGGVELDPLVNADNDRMPLRSKVLAVPALRQQYLRNIRTLAERMDWQHVGPMVAELRQLIRPLVQADTRKLQSTDAFLRATAEGSSDGLHHFFRERSAYLLEHSAAADASPQPAAGP